MKDKATLLEFGKGGHTLYLKKESSGMAYCQGYASPDTFCKPYHWWADPPEKMSTHWDNYEIPAEGIPVVDVTEAVKTDAGYKWVLLGPMYSPEVQDREADETPMPSQLMFDALSQSGYGTLLKTFAHTKRTQKRSSLDFVSASEFIEGWREHGARIGRFYVRDGNGIIEWE